jgi:hypothetical protein
MLSCNSLLELLKQAVFCFATEYLMFPSRNDLKPLAMACGLTL